MGSLRRSTFQSKSRRRIVKTDDLTILSQAHTDSTTGSRAAFRTYSTTISPKIVSDLWHNQEIRFPRDDWHISIYSKRGSQRLRQGNNQNSNLSLLSSLCTITTEAAISHQSKIIEAFVYDIVSSTPSYIMLLPNFSFRGQLVEQWGLRLQYQPLPLLLDYLNLQRLVEPLTAQIEQPNNK